MAELPEELRNRPPRPAGQEPTATLTLDAYTRLRSELEELTTSGRDTIAERIKAAREHGDIRENAEYDAAKNEQGTRWRRASATSRPMLRDPEIVEAPASADEVGPGMLVTVKPLDLEDEDETYLLAEHAEERAPGARTVTTSSPVRFGAHGRIRRRRGLLRGSGRNLPLPGRSRSSRSPARAGHDGPRARSRATGPEAPRVRDLPAPRKNESAAGGAMQRVFAWPYRAILAFLIWTGVRPWQLTLLSLALNVVTGVLIVTGAWLAAGGVLILAGRVRRLRRVGRPTPRRGQAGRCVHGLGARPCLRHDLVLVPVLASGGRWRRAWRRRSR